MRYIQVFFLSMTFMVPIFLFASDLFDGNQVLTNGHVVQDNEEDTKLFFSIVRKQYWIHHNQPNWPSQDSKKWITHYAAWTFISKHAQGNLTTLRQEHDERIGLKIPTQRTK